VFVIILVIAIMCTCNVRSVVNSRYNKAKTWIWSWWSWLSLCCFTWTDGAWHPESPVYWGRPIQWQPVWHISCICEGGSWKGM